MIGKIYNKQYTYAVYLAKPNKELITALDYIDITYDPKFRDFNELSLVLSYYENGWLQVKDYRFDLAKGAYLILLEIKSGDTVIQSEYFIIDRTSIVDDGTVKNEIHCYSSHYMIFNKNRLRAYKDVRKLYDPNNSYDFDDNTKGGIINLMTHYLYNTWSVGYINPIYLDVYHSFDFSDNTYTDIFKSLEQSYNCHILFDNVNNQINIYAPDEYGSNLGLVISNENYAKSMNIETKIEQMITRLFVYGKDNISVNKYNITGQSYVDNFDWLLDNGYFSDSLAIAMNNYKSLVASKDGDFTSYVNALNGLESTLLTKQNELSLLNAQLKTIEDSMDVEKNNSYFNTTAYNTYYSQYLTKQSQITTKKNEITVVQGQINTINNNITTLQTIISYANNFTQEQLEELVSFIWVETLDLNDVNDEELLYQYAKQYIILKSTPPIDLDIDMVDILSTKEAQLDWGKAKVGDFANLYNEKLGYNYLPIRIVAISHNKISNSLRMTLSNQDKLNTDLLYIGNILSSNNNSSTTVDVYKDTYAQYSEEKDNLINIGDTIDSDTTPIEAGNLLINRRGFIGSDIGSYGRIQVLNDKIIFSKDDFQNYYTLLSANGLYLETSNRKSRVVITPEYGIQIDKGNGSGVWSNAFYVDTDGNIHMGNSYIELSTSKNSIYIDPSVGIKITNTSTSTDVFTLDINGNIVVNNATVQGIFKTGTTGARIEIDNNGIKSYKTGSIKQGLFIDPNYADLKLYYSDSLTFNISQDVTTADLRYNTTSFLSIGTSEADPKGTWNFVYSTAVNGLNTDYSGTHNHGISGGTKLAIVDDTLTIIGYIEFVESGIHYHNVKKA